MAIQIAVAAGIGLLVGVVLTWLALRSGSASLGARLSFTEKELTAVKADLARTSEQHRELLASRARLESALESEKKASNDKVELLTKAGERAAEDLPRPCAHSRAAMRRAWRDRRRRGRSGAEKRDDRARHPMSLAGRQRARRGERDVPFS